MLNPRAATAHWLSLSPFTHKSLPIPHWKCHCRARETFGMTFIAFNLLDRKGKLCITLKKKERLKARSSLTTITTKHLEIMTWEPLNQRVISLALFSFIKCQSGCRCCQVKQDDGLHRIHVCSINELLVEDLPLPDGGKWGQLPHLWKVKGISFSHGQTSPALEGSEGVLVLDAVGSRRKQ